MAGDLSVAFGIAEAALQQLTMLITAEGKWVLPDSEEFLAALGDPNPDYDAVGFAVRNLGFVKFQVLDRLVTEIELHPRNVDLRALLALEKLLGEAGTNLFRIKYLEDEWCSEISASAEHTIERLRELCAPVFEPPATERFHVESLAIPPCCSIRTAPLGGLGLMAMKWRVAFGKFDSQRHRAGQPQRDLLPLMAVMGFDCRAYATPVWRFLGDGHRWAGNGSTRSARIGDKVEKHARQGIRQLGRGIPPRGRRRPVSRATTSSPPTCG